MYITIGIRIRINLKNLDLNPGSLLFNFLSLAEVCTLLVLLLFKILCCHLFVVILVGLHHQSILLAAGAYHVGNSSRTALTCLKCLCCRHFRAGIIK